MSGNHNSRKLSEMGLNVGYLQSCFPCVGYSYILFFLIILAFAFPPILH
jgi:hypothetical protein